MYFDCKTRCKDDDENMTFGHYTLVLGKEKQINKVPNRCKILFHIDKQNKEMTSPETKYYLNVN